MKRLKIIIWLVVKLAPIILRKELILLLMEEFLPGYHLRRNPVQKKREDKKDGREK